MDNLTDAWVSILNCKWPDGHSGGRDLWQDTDPLCSLAPGKRQLKKPLVSGWNTGSIAPLDKSLFTAVCKPGVYCWCWWRWVCESLEVVTPAPTWLFPRVHDAQQLPSGLCLCGAKSARWAPTHCTSLAAGRGRSSSGGVVCMEMTLSASSTPRPSPTVLLLSTLLWELLLLLLASVQGTGLGTKGTPRGSRQIWTDWSQWPQDSESYPRACHASLADPWGAWFPGRIHWAPTPSDVFPWRAPS